MEPSYLKLARTGELERRAAEARRMMDPCTLCPRRCQAARESDQRGACRTGRRAVVGSVQPHFGEERPLVGRHGADRCGSGTIFFAWCNLACVFCQNSDLSAQGVGSETEADELASMMLALQAQGCLNINFVSPSHVVAQILDGLVIAVRRGLRLPLVYNTGGYDAVKTLALLDGIVDIYMPDMKYAEAAVGHRLSGVLDYPRVNQAAVREMRRQVGDLALDARGVAQRGLLVRHLVLPDEMAGTPTIAGFLAREISRDTYVNVMDQYHPSHQAYTSGSLNRRVMSAEHADAERAMREAGLHRLDGNTA
ncbi:MAG: radical SAM protein [bacterium]|nr:radical SAM protein [bacterium]